MADGDILVANDSGNKIRRDRSHVTITIIITSKG